MSKFCFIAFLFVILNVSCVQKKTNEDNLSAAKDSITQLVNNTSKNITANGPIGWLDEFENSPDFYMANDGAIALTDYHAAEKFIKDTLVKSLHHVKLQFSDLRVTPLSAESGSVGAAYNEELTVADNKVIPISGYFTATAHHTAAGWKYVNIHWSGKK